MDEAVLFLLFTFIFIFSVVVVVAVAEGNLFRYTENNTIYVYHREKKTVNNILFL